MSAEIFTKRLELLHTMTPGLAPIAVLIKPLGPGNQLGPSIELLVKSAQEAAASIGRPIEVLTASSNAEIDSAFASLVQKRIGALLIAPQALFADPQYKSPRSRRAMQCRRSRSTGASQK
jgi:putative tryptophan/tyrosine transport system substrate-binding protein